jgi:sigma-E factor negative regulatory protein RseC
VIEQFGTVLEVRSGQARIQGGAAPFCGACGAHGGCGTSALAQFFQHRSRALWAIDELGVHVGDRVVIGLDEQALQRASVVVYAWPLLGLLGGAVAGDLWAAPGGAELGAVVTGLTGLLAGVLLARRYARRLTSDRRYQAHVARIASAAVAPTATFHTFRDRIPE